MPLVQSPDKIISARPQRIISLVPSITELLYDLELDDEVIGITKFCVHPDKWFRTKTRIGGTKNINIEKIKLLHPDLIIANKEENVKEQVESLSNLYPVWLTDITDLDDALKMIKACAYITGKKEKVEMIIRNIKNSFVQNIPDNKFKKALYLIWQNPYMSIGGDTFINDMLKKAGFKNSLQDKTRYPSLTNDEIIALNPEYVLLSSEPFPFKQKHIDEMQSLLPDAKIKLVDGEMFSWYGSRMMYAAPYFKTLHYD